jgi:hypothetical protein
MQTVGTGGIMLSNRDDLRLRGDAMRILTASCGSCGSVVEAHQDGMPAPDPMHLHYSGICEHCGSVVNWHRTRIGRLGKNLMLSPARWCPAVCGQDNPVAAPSAII